MESVVSDCFNSPPTVIHQKRPARLQGPARAHPRSLDFSSASSIARVFFARILPFLPFDSPFPRFFFPPGKSANETPSGSAQSLMRTKISEPGKRCGKQLTAIVRFFGAVSAREHSDSVGSRSSDKASPPPQGQASRSSLFLVFFSIDLPVSTRFPVWGRRRSSLLTIEHGAHASAGDTFEAFLPLRRIVSELKYCDIVDPLEPSPRFQKEQSVQSDSSPPPGSSRRNSESAQIALKKPEKAVVCMLYEAKALLPNDVLHFAWLPRNHRVQRAAASQSRSQVRVNRLVS